VVLINIVRLVDEKRKVPGKAADAWTEPAHANLLKEMRFLSSRETA
jgi:hypothetical protein